MSKSKDDPILLERVATLEADMRWVKRLVSIEVLLLAATLLGVLVQLVR